MPSNTYRENNIVKFRTSCLLKPVIIKKKTNDTDEFYT